MTHPGGYLHSITIQQKTASVDAYGGQVFTWSTFASPRCKIAPISGRELVTAKAEQSELSTRFYMRFLSGITPAMRIVDASGQKYEIVSVVNVRGLSRETEILAKAWVIEA